MKKLTVLATTLLLSATAFAGSQTTYSEKNIKTDGFATKAAAYEAGFDAADALADASKSELRFKLSPSTDKSITDIQIDDTQITIEEFAQAQGEIAYRAIVNVDYHFDSRFNSND